MNIQHLNYFIALAQRSNYREAAEFCNVSQPAISMAIKNFENKLGQKLFLRQKSPVELSDFGKELLPHAEKIVHHYNTMMAFAGQEISVDRKIRLGIIPTVAPYLLPKFLAVLQANNSSLKIEVEEGTTQSLIEKIGRDNLDLAIFATPVEDMALKYEPIYFEEFLVYGSNESKKQFLVPADLDLEKLWLLQEGHCLRNQVIDLCELQNQLNPKIKYNAGSIETIINLVEQFGGITIIPELASKGFSAKRKEKVRPFKEPAPGREISLVYHRFTVKQPEINIVKKAILSFIPKHMQQLKKSETIEVKGL